MNIFIGSDHAGYELKEYLRNVLAELGHRVIDCGAYEYKETDDYPIFISKVAKAVSEAEELRVFEESLPAYEAVPLDLSVVSTVSTDNSARQNTSSSTMSSSGVSITRGIVIGGSGQGEAIAANKFKHVRAALCYGGVDAEKIITLSREHNDSNVLSLGARFLDADKALELVLKWLHTDFTGDIRHVRRLAEIEQFSHETLYE